MKLKIMKFNNVKSTNDEAIKLIKSQKNSPTLIHSNNQTNGRGTMGKKWLSKKGNVFISIFFKMNPKKYNFKEYAILNPYIIKSVIKKFSDFSVTVKWPNDLMIKKRKVCGILQEIIEYKSNKYLIIGIGINTNHAPHNNSFKSISLLNCSKIKIKNEAIIKNIKITYEKFLSDIDKYNLSYLKKKTCRI
tara:strand:+ start:68 stop:637 length:570 start_codon:yes stop_codon:yes gene_type:complete